MSVADGQGLVVRAMRGDEKALNDLLEEHRGYVRKVVADKLGVGGSGGEGEHVFRDVLRDLVGPDRAEAVEDLTQEVLIAAFRQLRQLRRPELFLAWLAEIARSAAARAVREDVAAREHAQEWVVSELGAVESDVQILDRALRESDAAANKRRWRESRPGRDTSLGCLLRLMGEWLRVQNAQLTDEEYEALGAEAVRAGQSERALAAAAADDIPAIVRKVAGGEALTEGERLSLVHWQVSDRVLWTRPQGDRWYEVSADTYRKRLERAREKIALCYAHAHPSARHFRRNLVTGAVCRVCEGDMVTRAEKRAARALRAWVRTCPGGKWGLRHRGRSRALWGRRDISKPALALTARVGPAAQ